MTDQISSRRKHSSEVRTNAEELLASRIGEWSSAETIAEKVCVYTTGSFGRSDACKFSDLDVFIVALTDVTSKRLLTRLEEIELVASIVHVNRELGLPELDGDGGFLKVHTLDDYLVGLGKPSDDANNTFTGRLLLLLESQPIFGHEVYDKLLEECIARYWIDFSDHADSFLPAFLLNDVLRFWRTLCVNYEAGSFNDPAKRRAKNYKLKFSRLLTCFSLVLGLQVEFKRSGTISMEAALELVKLTPLERLERSSGNAATSLTHHFDKLTSMYEDFLVETNRPKTDLYEQMKDPDYYKASLAGAREFGDTMYKLLLDLAESEKDDPNSWRYLRYVTV